MNTCYNEKLLCMSCRNEENHPFIYVFGAFSFSRTENECLFCHEGIKI